MANPHDIITGWMKDAHAMERASIDNLETQVSHLNDYPELQAKFRDQIELTRRQQQRIDAQLRAMGSEPSTAKELMTRMAGKLQAMLAGASEDEVVKQAASTLAYENWEIANFRALAAAARHEGEQSLGTMFDEMANEKGELANWLAEALPTLTDRYLDMQARA